LHLPDVTESWVNFIWLTTRAPGSFCLRTQEPDGRHRRGRGRRLSERAAIAIINDVPHVYGSKLFHLVGNPATIDVKRTILAASGA
jgi:hypothetical protein